jgi:hypothetical protein
MPSGLSSHIQSSFAWCQSAIDATCRQNEKVMRDFLVGRK